MCEFLLNILRVCCNFCIILCSYCFYGLQVYHRGDDIWTEGDVWFSATQELVFSQLQSHLDI